MKFSCLQENLAKGLAIVGRAVATRSTLPVLSNILMATDQGRLKLSATNLEVGISCWIGAKVEEDGATTVPARLLTDFVNSLPPDRIDAELVTRTQTLNLKCSHYEANIKGIDAQEFPIIQAISEDMGMAFEPATLREMINQVSFAAAVDESRPVLTGVLADLSGANLTMAAADGLGLLRADTSQFLQCPGWNDHLGGLWRCLRQLRCAHGQSESISSSHGEVGAREIGEHSGQHRAALINSSSEGHLVDHLP